MNIGLISDTHGLLRPEALAALQGSDLIVHAGDIGAPEILDRLREIAPLVAVRGNNDTDAWAQATPETQTFDAGGQQLHLLHDLKTLAIDPSADGVSIVVAGHSHRPKIETRNGVLYINPGSAGPRRFSLPVTVAHLRVGHGRPQARIVDLFDG
ncbi:metallophosphoesterase family protein [Solimonas marina]|uniref:Phosphoesterase n=1 Tax=Solimonas marina TaxID=2714601 RepID=A0A970B5V8_9GAMM|nr:metallophosphoesterase family protein [Solimonas marina]NKF22133.1 metallophosphoesterase family protein [Solimonas marina]